MIAPEKIATLIDRFQFLEAKMADRSAGSDIAKLGKEYAELRPVVETVTAYKELVQQIVDAESMLDDPEMRELAEMELPDLRISSMRSNMVSALAGSGHRTMLASTSSRVKVSSSTFWHSMSCTRLT